MAELTKEERESVIDTGRHVYGCCSDDCEYSGAPEDAQIKTVERILTIREFADERRGAVRALRRFADTLGVNVGDEDDEWWQGYRQAQRECLHDASDAADRIEAES